MENKERKIKYIDEKTFSVFEFFGIIEKEELLYYIFTAFNQKGQCLYKLDDDMETLSTYHYDSKGNVTKEVCKDFYNRSYHIIRYKYNSKGKLIESIRENSYTFNSKTIYKYNSKGYLKEENICDGCGRTIYKYDSLGNKIEEIVGDNDENIDYQTSYKYDSNKNLVQETYSEFYGEKLNIVETRFYEYFEEGSFVRIIIKDENDNIKELKERKIIFLS